MDIGITWETLLAIFGGVAIIAGGAKAIAGLFAPFKTLKIKAEGHDRMLDNDKKRLDELEESNKVFGRALLALLNHEITGNSVDKLQTAMTALQDYLLKK